MRALHWMIPVGLLGLALAGCNNGDGTGAATGGPIVPLPRTVLAFLDDCGNPLGAGGRITGMVEGAGGNRTFLLKPGLDGRAILDLLPGTYTVTAQIHDRPGSAPTEIRQAITVADPRVAGQVNVALTPAAVAAAWAKYDAGDYVGALAALQAVSGQVGSGAQGSVDNALGWTQGALADFSAAEAAFAAAQGNGCTGTDAQVGLSGVKLTENLTVGHVQDAVALLSDAIARPGDYSSAPTHGDLTENDLVIMRALAEFLAGDLAACRADLSVAQG
ncbi:MAG: hypothetical protein ABI743_07920, partial [bacterium]